MMKSTETKMNRRDFLASAGLLAWGVASRSPAATSTAGKPTAAAVPVGLDDLATAWLRRRITHQAAMPGLGNDLGSIQMEADIAAFKHPVFPPYSAGNEITALTMLNGRNLAQVAPFVEIQWRAYAVDRRCSVDGWHLESRTSLLPDQPGVVVRLAIKNSHYQPRRLRLGFLLSGRAVNNGGAGYSWRVPSIPTDVWSLNIDKGLKQSAHAALGGAGVCLENEAGNAFSIQGCHPAPDAWERERVPTWSREMKPNETFTVTLLFTFHPQRDEAERIAAQWQGRTDEALASAKRRWEKIWQAAFTPKNDIFSGHLPIVHGSAAVQKLYYMGVLTLLACRRRYGWGVVDACYLTLWPRRGEGSVYLAWDLPYVSGILARLDPDALRGMLKMQMEAPWLEYQVTNLFTGQHGHRACCTHPQAITTSCLNLMRWQADQSWRTWTIKRWPLKWQQALAAKQPVKAEPETLTGEGAYRQALMAHKAHRLAGSNLVDFGGKGPYLECITTYAHGTAGHTAIQAWALREHQVAFGESHGAEREALLRDLMGLFRADRGFFACQFPDGRKYDAANLYDVGLVLNSVGAELPREWVGAMNRFVREELATPTWAHCLWPGDLDIASGTRADHQWAGCFPAWPAQFLLGSLRAGHYEDWNEEWLTGISRVTAQGPFAQAYWAEDMAEPEAGAAPKCSDELPQGNHWAISSGCFYAELVLDGVAGLRADVKGNLEADTRDLPLRRGLQVEGIACCGREYVLDGKLRKLS
jgi:hypothetical protein